MLPVKYLVASIAVCVMHTSLVTGEGYNIPEHTGSTKTRVQEQLALAKTLEVYVPIPVTTMRPEVLPVKETKVDVHTPSKTPCPQLPTPMFEMQSDTEALTTETPVHKKADIHKIPVHEKPDIHKTPYTRTPAPSEPCPTFTLVPETEAPQSEKMTRAYPPLTRTSRGWSTSALATETDARQHEKATETNSGSAPTAPCPKLILASETEAPQIEDTTKAYLTPTQTTPTYTQHKESSKTHTHGATDASLSPYIEAPTQTDEAIMGVTDEATESGGTVKAGSRITDASLTDPTNVISTDDVFTTEESGDAYSKSIPTQSRHLRSH